MATIRIYREEVRDPDTLPSVCMKCGAPATTRVNCRFTWYPGWVNVLIPVGWLPWVIVRIVLERNMRVPAPMCAKHRHHWRLRRILTIGGLLLAMALALGAIGVGIGTGGQGNGNQIVGALLIGAGAVFSVWIPGAIILHLTSIRTVIITEELIALRGVSERFCDLLGEEDARMGSVPVVLPVQAIPTGGPTVLSQQAATGTKQCPNCAETIKAIAVKCRFCGEFLEDA